MFICVVDEQSFYSHHTKTPQYNTMPKATIHLHNFSVKELKSTQWYIDQLY